MPLQSTAFHSESDRGSRPRQKPHPILCSSRQAESCTHLPALYGWQRPYRHRCDAPLPPRWSSKRNRSGRIRTDRPGASGSGTQNRGADFEDSEPRLDEETVKQIVVAKKEYLLGLCDVLEKRYGGAEQYFRDYLKMSAAEVQVIKSNLIVDVKPIFGRADHDPDTGYGGLSCGLLSSDGIKCV